MVVVTALRAFQFPLGTQKHRMSSQQPESKKGENCKTCPLSVSDSHHGTVSASAVSDLL